MMDQWQKIPAKFFEIPSTLGMLLASLSILSVSLKLHILPRLGHFNLELTMRAYDDYIATPT
jgi:hypothetical protein